jgi:hypothetical protein
MGPSLHRAHRATWAAIAALLAAACGPAPYALGPDDAPASEAPPAAAYVVVTEGQPTPAREPEDRWIPDGYPRINPFVERRTWVGDYDCVQGRTNLTLRVIDVRGKLVRAIFDFYHVRTNTAGQYIVGGAFDEQNGDVVLEPGPWIIQPPGYEAVAMKGRVSRDERRFTGTITSPGCFGFRLHPAR